MLASLQRCFSTEASTARFPLLPIVPQGNLPPTMPQVAQRRFALDRCSEILTGVPRSSHTFFSKQSSVEPPSRSGLDGLQGLGEQTEHMVCDTHILPGRHCMRLSLSMCPCRKRVFCGEEKTSDKSFPLAAQSACCTVFFPAV